MASGPHNSDSYRPSEADLLAWVEGERLSPEVDSAVARLLMSDQKLARELELMREDRLGLQLLKDEVAPAGLMEAVESAMQPVLERQLLLGLQNGEPVESRPVVSMVRPEKRGIFATFMADRVGRRMAMAASLLLLVGGVTYLGTTLLSRGPATTSPGPIAIKTPTKTADRAQPETFASRGANPNTNTSAVPTETNVAVVPPKSEAAKVVESTPVEAPAVTVASGNATDGPMVGPINSPIDAAQAAELARDRKLVIRVISSAAAKTPSAVADRLKKETGSSAWKLSSEISSELAAALKPEGDAAGLAKNPETPEPPKVAGDAEAIARGLDPDVMGPPAPPSATAPLEVATALPSVYLVQARLDAATMAQLKSTLQKAGRADDVVFEEQREPLPLDANAPILNPNAVLWWDAGPSGWANWGEVPVVIDPNR